MWVFFCSRVFILNACTVMFILWRFLAYSSGLLFLGGIILHYSFSWLLYTYNSLFFPPWTISGILYIIGIFMITISSIDWVKISNTLKYQLFIVLFLLINIFSTNFDWNTLLPQWFFNNAVGFTFVTYIRNIFPLILACWIWSISWSNQSASSVTLKQQIWMICWLPILYLGILVMGHWILFILVSTMIAIIIVLYLLLRVFVYISKKLDSLKQGYVTTWPYKITMMLAQKWIRIWLFIVTVLLVPLIVVLYTWMHHEYSLILINIVLSGCTLIIMIPLFFRIYLNYFNKNI